MLAVQVQYLNYLENKRHDIQVEYETRRHDLVTEDIGYRTQAEQGRHNLVTEQQNQQSINEAIRHDKATEAIGFMQANAALQQAETSRMLANAQIPLITAQAYSAKEQAKQEKYKTYYANQYHYGKTKEALYKAETARLESENYSSLNYLKAIGDIIPF